MENALERELKGAIIAVLIAGMLSCIFMVFSEFPGKEFRFSLKPLFAGVTIFTSAVITFFLNYPTHK